MRDILDPIPKEWIRISRIEGQGWKIFVPCGSPAGKLHIAPDSSDRLQLECEFCSSLGKASILKVMRFAGGHKVKMDLSTLGTADVESVTDAVADRFADAPVKGHVLTWHYSTDDSLVFVPVSDAEEFETLKAEDESPQGCDGKKP